MFRKIKQQIKAAHEKKLVKDLKNSGWFSDGHINVLKKTVHLGQWGFVWVMLEPKYKLKIQMLCRFHGWCATETKLVITFLGKTFIH